MAKYPRIREQHIAVFGESGSGKTVRASSFYGATQEKAFSNDFWDLVAATPAWAIGYKNYVGMRDHATAPGPTRFAGTTYYFSVKIKGGGNAKATKKRPFDTLRLAWHDYPGEWLDESPSSEEEAHRRVDTFRSRRRPTSRSCWWMARGCWTTGARRSATSSRS
jgi:hypothetical protein